jgi:hypothetical protein
MIKKLINQPYAPKWEQEEEEKIFSDAIGGSNSSIRTILMLVLLIEKNYTARR